MDLTHADLHLLQASEGFLDLGMIVEAFNELEEIAPLNRAHPAVLLMRSRAARPVQSATQWGGGHGQPSPGQTDEIHMKPVKTLL